MKKRNLLISVVAPVYNNARHLPLLLEEIRQSGGGYRYEVIFTDDGSPDDSWQVIAQLARLNDKSCTVRGLKLSRNFGQHAAIYAGLSHARGDYVVVLDADLQDDPVYIPELIAKAQAGFDVVHTQRVKKRRSLRRFISEIVYRILTIGSEIPLHRGMGNYKLMSRRALAVMLEYREYPPLFELMAERAGFPAGFVEIRRRSRPVNVSAYRMADSFRFIAALLFTYSSLLFRCFVVCGALLTLSGMAGLLWVVLGNAAVMTAVLLGITLQGGLILLVGGIIGLHVRSAQRAARSWPIFTVDKII
ncbi:MAG: glycosyltransferase family 2 protein [Leptospiraceae bacterium]|nr:glycosyltransferase family 2 protein [Leptospiraceae bacterium]